MKTITCALLLVSTVLGHASTISFVKNKVYTLQDTNKVTALVQSKIDNNSVVGTEADSMCELAFDDKTVTRIGANATFSYSEPERIIKLKQGTFVVAKVPETASVQVEAGSVTAAIAGSTVSLNVLNGTTHIAVLETTTGVNITHANGKTFTLQSGQGMSADASGFTSESPSDVNVSEITKGELFSAPGPLENAPLIAGVAAAQAVAISKGFAFESKTSGAFTSDNAIPDGLETDTAAGATAAPDTQQPRMPASLMVPPVTSAPEPAKATPL